MRFKDKYLLQKMLRAELASLITICFLGYLMSCSSPMAEFDAAARVEVSKEINAALTAFHQHMRNRNFEALPAFYADTPEFHWMEDGQIRYPSREALLAALNAFGEAFTTESFLVDTSIVYPISRTQGWVTVKFVQKMRGAQNFTFEIKGGMTAHLRKHAGQWQFTRGHTSSLRQRND